MKTPDISSSESGDLDNVFHLGIFSANRKHNPLVKFQKGERSKMERSNSQTVTYKSITF